MSATRAQIPADDPDRVAAELARRGAFDPVDAAELRRELAAGTLIGRFVAVSLAWDDLVAAVAHDLRRSSRTAARRWRILRL